MGRGDRKNSGALDEKAILPMQNLEIFNLTYNLLKLFLVILPILIITK